MFLEIKVYVTQGNKPIGYDYHRKLHGFVSKLLGNETYGSTTNNYVYSNLNVPEYKKDGIWLKNGKGYFIIRTNNPQAFVNFITNYDTLKDKEIFYDIHLDGFNLSQIDSVKKTKFRTMIQSPILINGDKNLLRKDWLDDNDIHKCENYITNNIIEKAKSLNVSLDKDLKVKIKNQKKHSDIVYNGVYNKGRVFDLEINCDDNTKEFILLNGIGRSCGIGFGMIY